MVDAKQFIGKTTRYSEAAFNALNGGKPGDIISHDQLRATMDAGELDHDKFRQIVYSARMKLIRKSICWWKWEGSSVVCVPIDKQSKEIDRERRKINRQSRRTLQRASCCDVSALPRDDRTQFDLAVTQAAMANMATSTKMAKKLTEAGTLEPPKLEDVAKLFGKQ